MSTAARESPPEAGVSWRSVRGGLGQFAITFALLTLLSAGSRLWSIDSIRDAAGTSTQEAQVSTVASFLLFGLAYQLGYSLLTASLAAAAVRITRAPRRSGAVTPALLSAIAFGALVLIVLTLLTNTITPEDRRQLAAAAIGQFWFAAVIARTLALGAIGVALIALARHLKADFKTPLLAGLAMLLAIDAAAALYALAAPGAASSARFPLVLVQLGFAWVLVSMAWQLRRVVRPLADAEQNQDESGASAKPEREHEHEHEHSEPAAAEPDISPAARFFAALLTAAAGAALPFWDASEPRMRFDLGSPTLGLSAVIALAGVVAGLWVFRELASDAYRARLAVAVAAVVGIGYAGFTLYSAALARSKLTDRLPVCESGETPGLAAPSEPLLTPIEGPRLMSGTPCTLASERRLEHLEEHPSGSFQDGLVQIGRRYTADRARMFGGTLFVLAALALAGLLVFRAAPPELERDPEIRQ